MMISGIKRAQQSSITRVFARHLCSKEPPSTHVPTDSKSEGENSSSEKKSTSIPDEIKSHTDKKVSSAGAAKQRMAALLQSFKVKDSQTPQKAIKKPVTPSLREIKNIKNSEPSERKLYSGIDPEMRNAVKGVAKTLGKGTEAELVESLRMHKLSMEKSKYLLSNMELDKAPEEPKENFVRRRSGQYDTTEDHRRSFAEGSPYKERSMDRDQGLQLFGGEPLNIFQDPPETEVDQTSSSKCILDTWGKLKDIELKSKVSHHPRNGFEEMIQWTEKGMLWKFPIDNEIGLEEEKQSTFADHIFLERHLVGWCPLKGPIRHFMELVCTGLSKNSHLTVERKVDHIEWYKLYFDEKTELLREMGAA